MAAHHLDKENIPPPSRSSCEESTCSALYASNNTTDVSIVIDTADDIIANVESLQDEHTNSSPDPETKIQIIMDYAKTRQDEFARLLQEHAEIVHQINKHLSSLSSSPVSPPSSPQQTNTCISVTHHD